MKGKVFISGPIHGIRCGYEPVDPWQREKIIYKGTTHGWWKEVPAADFIKRDLEDIEKCDILIAYMPRLSAGTCMELFYAKMKGKKTICICKIRNPSPWIITHSDIILKKFKELEPALRTITFVKQPF